jgi:hypothetical protein
MNRPATFLSLLLVPLIAFTGCETGGANALAGAATGAAIGGLLHGRGSDALRGAAIGAGAGYLIGKVVNHERDARERRYVREGDRYADDDRDRDGYRDLPYARPTNRYGFVTSPYEPYNLIDVRGIPHGATVIDPSRGQRFINP